MKLILENWKRFLTEAEGHLEPVEVHGAPPADDDEGDDKAAQTQTNQKLAEKLAPLIASGRDGGSRGCSREWPDKQKWQFRRIQRNHASTRNFN